MTGPLVSQAWTYFHPELCSRCQVPTPSQQLRSHAFPPSSFPLPSHCFCVHLEYFKLATLLSEMLIGFAKLRFHLKAFSGHCTQSESKDDKDKPAMPPVAGKEGKTICPGRLFTSSFMRASVGSCVHLFMHVFMRTLDFLRTMCWVIALGSGTQR